MIPSQSTLSDLEEVLNNGAQVVDTRPIPDFAVGHIPGTINIPLGDSFSGWASWILDPTQGVYPIATADQMAGIMATFTAINISNVPGYFPLTIINDWQAAGQTLEGYDQTTPEAIAGQVESQAVTLIDVREDNEWAAGRIPNAIHISLSTLASSVASVPKDKPIVVQCRSGARSAAGVSVLQAHGFENVLNLQGGILGWQKAGLPISQD